MVRLTSLWSPILVSAVLVFVASSLSHAVLRVHRADFRKLPVEAEILDLLGRNAVPPGDYLFPRPGSRAEMKEPSFQEKAKKNPMGLMTLMPGGGNPMGRTFALWFLYCAVVGGFAGYVAGHALPPGAGAAAVFRLIAVAAFAGYGLALWQDSIWYGKSFATTLKFTADAVAYAGLTGGAFAWLWPK
jgi:hypothetical protein